MLESAGMLAWVLALALPAAAGEPLCGSSFSIERLAKDQTARERLAALGPSAREAQAYYECRALASGSEKDCAAADALAPLNRPEDLHLFVKPGKLGAEPFGRAQCLATFDALRQTRAFVARSKDALPLCDVMLARRGDLSKSDRKLLCESGLSAESGLDAACARAKPVLEKIVLADIDAWCRRRFRLLWGTEPDCAGQWGPLDSEPLCAAAAGLRAAVRAGDPRRCGLSESCRALLTRDASACRPIVERVKAAYCAAKTP